MLINRIVKEFVRIPRCFSTKKIAKTNIRKGPNPGANRYLNEMSDATEKITEDPESFGDLESDFMDVHKSHKQYTEEMEGYKEFIRLKIVKNKYFREKYPNFLTFAEKEQIRLLNSREPDEWTIEKLSESFPTDEDTIKKILKAQWYPRDEKRLRRHDEKVIENWEKFRKGEFSDLPTQLRDHLKKFATRKLSDLKNIETKMLLKRPILSKPNTNEFSSIITSCKAYQEKNITDGNKNLNLIEANKENEIVVNNIVGAVKDSGEDETFVFENVTNKNPITLSMLKNKIGLIENKEKKSYEQISNKNLLSDKSELDSNPMSIQKFNFNEIAINDTDMEKYNVTPIKERIHIPNKLWKKGATYKVKDCYYDYDGTFLYRVPGMTGSVDKQNS